MLNKEMKAFRRKGGQIAKVCILNPSRPLIQLETESEEMLVRWREIVLVAQNGCRSVGHFEGLLISSTQTRSRLTAVPWDKHSPSHTSHQEPLLPTDSQPTWRKMTVWK